MRPIEYIGSWLVVLCQDEKAIFRVASDTSKAADYLLAFDGEAA
jgi:antirestriction protein ArdC